MKADGLPLKQCIRQLGLVIVAIGVGIITLLVFPMISYFSATSYGLPTAIFLLLGYIIGINLFGSNPRMGIAFGIGFIPPVAFCLVILVAGGAPLSVLLSMLPVTCLWGFHNRPRGRNMDKHSV